MLAIGLVLIGMLYFGVRLKGFRPDNNVKWSVTGNGLVFDRFAEAYTEGFFSGSVEPDAKSGLAIEMVIQPKYSRYSGTRILLLVHDGDDDRQLVIGQWRNSLIIMNGDDFSNRHRIPKIYFELDGNGNKSHLITIVSNDSGTKLFLDGTLKKRNEDLKLRYPNGSAKAKLIVGNSFNGNSPWTGTIRGLAFFDRYLEDDVVGRHFQAWRLKSDFSAFKPDGPRLLYAFDEGRGQRVYNKLGDGMDLIVPALMKVLQPRVLSWPGLEALESPGSLEDVFINLVGFIPLGLLLIAALGKLEGIEKRSRLFIALLLVFSFSLCIEIVQVWIPSRNSSLLDLILNTLGGGMGVLLFRGVRV